MQIRAVGPGVFELGGVRMDKQQRTVSFPAVLNRDHGPMEYFLVTTYGKTHESILRTEVQPYHIHLAMLLLDAKGAGTNAFPGNAAQNPGGPLKNPSKETIAGDRVTIAVHWRVDGKETTRPAQDLVFNTQAKSVLGKGQWVYNGSQVWQGSFFAQKDGSLVTLITDPGALINNTGPGHDNDDIWTANTNNLPPPNTVLEVTIKLEDPQPRQ